MKKLVLVLTLAVSAPLWAWSGKQGSEAGPGDTYIRHIASDGVVHLNRILTDDAIRSGYQLLDAQGRVLEEVEGVNLNDEEARQRRIQQAQQAREDEELLRLYAGPDDAERARDRKIDALKLSISYEDNNLSQLEMKLDDEISTAARSERAGQPVPDAVLEAMERLKRQIATSKQKLESFEREIGEVNKEYSPIIKRLNEIKASKE